MNWTEVMAIAAVIGTCSSILFGAWKLVSNHLHALETRINKRIDEVREDVQRLELKILQLIHTRHRP